jgi:hypothetical protein
MESLSEALHSIVRGGRPMSVRQVFYQAVSRGLIAKTEAEYKNTICRLLAKMRLEGDMPFGWISDGTRWQRKPRTFSSLDAALGNIVRTYRRSLWDDQDAYVEIWLEKEALAGVVYNVTAEFDVPLMVTRGYPSLSFLAEAAEDIDAESDKDVHIFYFGDLDPSGVDIARNVEERLDEFTTSAYVNFERVAVTVEQVQELDLPMRPTKRTDTRSKDWVGGSVELDAIDPDTLRAMVRDCIEQLIDFEALEVVRTVEAEEREGLRRLIEREVES